ncbi:MAG: hypothetical protein ACK4N1_16925 [Pseudorhizobium sp.]
MSNRFAAMANTLAQDDTVASDEIAEAIEYMEMKLKIAAARKEPVPFVAFRTRTILQAALKLRQDAGLIS